MRMAATPRKDYEGATLCPVPQRPFQSPVPIMMPKEVSSPCSRWSDSEEASHELRDLLQNASKARLRGERPSFFDMRPDSAASTCAGPSPGLDERGSPFQWTSSPDFYASDRSDNMGSAKIATEAPQSSDSRRPSVVGGGMPQSKKVFIGGVPQDMTQDQLRAVFAKFGDVKKAWLQKERAERQEKRDPGAVKPHRGFGFVVFSEDAGVDNVLGQEFSRFIPLADGKRLEVKRALTSSVMANTQSLPKSSTPKPAPQRTGSLVDSEWAAGQVRRERTGSFQDRQQHQQAAWASTPPLVSTGDHLATSSSAAWTVSAAAPRHVITSVPASQPMATPQLATPQLAQGNSHATAPDLNSQVAVAAFPCMDSITQMLGSNNEGLERALKQAMPDHYDD